ncbi:LLM class flavin-dependent oxidoreductase [Aminobacter niigataensis]|uniref:LLM class flavin-dependent oxidoreductase n=1 Tax=Aminobacter niigataensis TaxID=83265 RepID=UPI0024C85C9D|nr:LLM class flavin-dependent oxidoreductase [Aminobacter niigataensis]CAI2931847.1 Bac_luciferase domain-containing protein [Aminobacter niigataensis]
MKKSDKPVGVFILGDLPPKDIAPVSRQIEKSGFDEIWIAEDCFMISGFASAAIALQATTTIKVGIGAVSNRVRHPAVAAMEAATLAGAFPGRFDSLGVAHGVPSWMKQIGLFPKSVLGALRESVTGIKRLVKGETVSEEGEYSSFENVKLTHAAPDVKVLTAVVGPKSVELSAQIADGMLISVLAGPKYVKAIRDQITQTRKASGLPEHFELVTYVLACVGDDRVAARNKVRDATAFYLQAMGPTMMTGVYGVNDTVEKLLAEDSADLANQIPDDWLDWIAIAGEPADAVKGIKELFAAGATSVVLCIVPSDELPQQVDLIGREVLPHI